MITTSVQLSNHNNEDQSQNHSQASKDVVDRNEEEKAKEAYIESIKIKLLQFIEGFACLSSEYDDRIEKLLQPIERDILFITIEYWDNTIKKLYVEKYVESKKIFVDKLNLDDRNLLKSILCDNISQYNLNCELFASKLSWTTKQFKYLRDQVLAHISRSNLSNYYIYSFNILNYSLD
jgi:hypothetical protein